MAALTNVVPCADCSMTRIVSSGSQRSAHVSRNVPLLPRPSSTTPHGTPSALTRCSSIERARPFGSAHVELDGLRIGGWTQPHTSLLRREVAGQRHLRRVVGYFADRIADDQLAIDERQSGAACHHRVGRVEHLVQAPVAAATAASPTRSRCASRRSGDRDSPTNRVHAAAEPRRRTSD